MARAQQVEEARPANIRYFNRNWDFDDVEIATVVRWIERARITVPVDLQGKVSGTLSVGVPWGALGSARAWRFGGRLTSPQLTVEGIELHDVAIALRYRDGTLRLEKLGVGIPASDGEGEQAAGQIRGTAAMGLSPLGDLTANVVVQNLSAARLSGNVAGLPPAQGRVNGSVEASAPVRRLTALEAWTASGNLAINDLVAEGFPAAAATVDFQLNEGLLTAKSLDLRVARTRVTGEAELTLADDYPWKANLAATTDDVASQLRLALELLSLELDPNLRRIIEGGVVELTAQAQGTIQPAAVTVAGRLSLADATITPPSHSPKAEFKSFQPVALNLNYAADSEVIRLQDIDARLLGGRVTGGAVWPLVAGDFEAALQWRGLQPSAMLARPSIEAGEFAGTLTLAVDRANLDDLASWNVDADITLSRLAYQQWNVTNVRTGSIALGDARLVVPEFRAELEGEPLVAGVDIQLAAPWNVTASFNLPRIELAWLQRLPDSPTWSTQLSGAVAATGRVSGRWQPLELTGSGQIVGDRLRYERFIVDSAAFDYAVEPESMTVSEFIASAFSGRITGDATIELGDNPGGTIGVAWTGIDAGAVVAFPADAAFGLAGSTSGSLKISMPAGALAEPRRWKAMGVAALGRLRTFEFVFNDVTTDEFILQNGTLHVPGVAATMDGRPVAAAATLGLDAPYPVKLQVEAAGFAAERLEGIPYGEALAGRLHGSAAADVELDFSVDPWEFTAAGDVAIDEITHGPARAADVNLTFDLQPATLTLSALRASVYDGRVTGRAVVPLAEGRRGSAELSWSEVQAGRIVRRLLESQLPLSGTTSGSAQVGIPAGELATPRAWQIDANASVDDLRVGSAQLASVKAQLHQSGGELQYSASGDVFEGGFQLEGVRDAATPDEGLPALGSAQLTLRGANVAPAAALAFARQPSSPALGGEFNMELATQTAQGQWSWRGAVDVASLTAGGTRVSPGVLLRVAGDERRLRIEQFSGQLAGGELTASGVWDQRPRGSRTFRATLRSAQLAELLLLTPGAADIPAAGRVTVSARIAPGAVWRIGADASVRRGELYDLPLRNVSAPLSIDWSPASGRLRVDATGIRIGLARGRMTGRLVARYSYGLSLDGNFRFYRVDASALTGSGVAQGRLTGTLELKGRNARSINDLQATLLADLEGAQARGVPVLDQVRRAVPGAALAGAGTFGDGRLEARLSRGVVQVDRLSLANRTLQLFITGQATLAGRLRLDAVVATFQGANATFAEALLTRLLAVPAAPAALLVQANDFLSNRVVHLAITGTLQRPIVRVRPFQSLREEVVRFLLRQASGGVVTGRNISLPR